MNFQNRRQLYSAFLMTICLCGWIGMTLLHDFSHAVHPDENHTPCAVCRVLPQSAPAVINTELALRAVPVFECVRQIETDTIPFRSQVFFAAAIPRGPPALPIA